jgi:alpha-D-ribose 1-methylphosphonate 5-triphosphate synthase subunit PhnH
MLIHIDDLWQAASQQAVYRRLLASFAYPARVEAVDDLLPGVASERALLATLCDASTTLADPDRLLPSEDWGFLKARPLDAGAAALVVVDGRLPAGVDPTVGDVLHPERGATLLLVVDALEPTPAPTAAVLRCRGPGIAGERVLSAEGLHPTWLGARGRWNARFPAGVDALLCAPGRFAALPRTTTVAQES